jgi:hypothetical protein
MADWVGVAERLGCLLDAAKTLMDSKAKCRQIMRHILGKHQIQFIDPAIVHQVAVQGDQLRNGQAVFQ